MCRVCSESHNSEFRGGLPGTLIGLRWSISRVSQDMLQEQYSSTIPHLGDAAYPQTWFLSLPIREIQARWATFVEMLRLGWPRTGCLWKAEFATRWPA